MTIKKRLLISNIMMIIVPVIFTSIIGSACITSMNFILSKNSEISNTHEFYFYSHDISEQLAAALSKSQNFNKNEIEKLEDVLKTSKLSLNIKENGRIKYTYGEIKDSDEAMIQSVTPYENEVTVFIGDRGIYGFSKVIDDKDYSIYIVGNISKAERQKEDAIGYTYYIIVIITVIFSVLLTNRFLIKFVFHRIEDPINVLLDGVSELAKGNLEYRILYDSDNEFAPICQEFNHMAAQLKDSIEEIERHEESRKELLVGISHDIRSPLTSIQAYVEGILDGVANTPEKQQKYLKMIKTKSEEIQRMVSQLFLFSKMELGEHPINKIPLFLNQELEKFMVLHGEEYKTKGLEIKLELVPVYWTAAPDQFERIITNILDNSLKYKNRDIGHMIISAEETDNVYRIRFTDDGPGVNEEAVNKIFDVFYRSDPARKNPNNGSGIGLAIVQKAVQEMNGKVYAENDESGGLTIVIELQKGVTNV